MTYDRWRVKLTENATLLGRDQELLRIPDEDLYRMWLRGLEPTMWSLWRDAERGRVGRVA